MMREIAIDAGALSFRQTLYIGGAQCQLATNSYLLTKSLRFWRTTDRQAASGTFSMQVLVTPERTASSQPHFRGMRHLVIASFGQANLFIFDLIRRNVCAVISPELAEERAFWDRILVPIALGVLGPAVGVVPVHSACVAADGMGVLIGGASGAGKSTLSVALAQHGFDYISDDWSYLSLHEGRLAARGLSVPVKLLPDAVAHFPMLARHEVGIALNGEPAYEMPLEEMGAHVRLSCQPRWFLSLQRSDDAGCRLEPADPQEVQQYVERSVERLPLELDELAGARSAVINHMTRLSCWKLTYGGPPQVAAQGLQRFFAQELQGVPA